MMPASNRLIAANTYGQTSFTDLYGWQHIEQDFGQITLRNLQGTVAITARYADVTASDVEAILTCEANKSAVQLLRVGGTATVHNQYGSVHAQPTADLRKLLVEADRTKVIISAPQLEQFTYQLSVQQGNLLLPNVYQAAKRIVNGRTTLNTKILSTRPVIRVSTSYAPLTLQTQEFVLQP